jgi:hypothetical protein
MSGGEVVTKNIFAWAPQEMGGPLPAPLISPESRVIYRLLGSPDDPGTAEDLLAAANMSPLFWTHVPSINEKGQLRWDTLRETPTTPTTEVETPVTEHEERLARVRHLAREILDGWQREDQETHWQTNYPWWKAEDDASWVQRYFPADGTRPDSDDYTLPNLLTISDGFYGLNPDLAAKTPDNTTKETGVKTDKVDPELVEELAGLLILQEPTDIHERHDEGTFEIAPGQKQPYRYWKFVIPRLPCADVRRGAGETPVWIQRPMTILSDEISTDPEGGYTSLLAALGYNHRILRAAEAVARTRLLSAAQTTAESNLQ